MEYPLMTPEERRSRLRLPAGKLPLVIDSDAKNEIDDQFAIAWALRLPERFQVEAVYAAPFSHDCLKAMFRNRSIEHAGGITYEEDPAAGMEQSYEEIKKLFELLQVPSEGRVFRGAGSYLSAAGDPVKSDAVEDLIERAMACEDVLYVAAIGAITNIASAILLKPDIIKKIVVVWLGGQPLYFNHGIEFNLMQDVTAARVLFDSGVPLIYIPCMNVASMLMITEDEVKAKLLHKSRIGSYLAGNVLDAFGNSQGAAFAAAMLRRSYLLHREDQDEEYLSRFGGSSVAWSRIIWDAAPVAFLRNPGWTPSTLEVSPVLKPDLTWGDRCENRHEIRVVNYCHRDLIFGDMFAALAND